MRALSDWSLHYARKEFNPDESLDWIKDLPRARYCKDLPEQFVGVPNVEALGPIPSIDEINKSVTCRPKYDRAKDIWRPLEHRLHCLPLLTEVVEPLPIHFALWNAISINVRHRQMRLNYFKRHRRELEFGLDQKPVQLKDCYSNRLKSPAPAILVCGPTGSGKNNAIESCLNIFPYQACWHEKYTDGRPINLAQVVWAKIDCSYDATISGIAYGLFGSLDDALGTNYLGEFVDKRLTNDTLLAFWQRLAVKHSLAVLWVDEVNCLVEGGKADGKLILNFFLKVSNLLGIVIIFSGTNAASGLFASKAHNARRVCTGGTFEIELYPNAKDETFSELFLRPIFRYQWVKNPVPYGNGYRDVIFELTCGIHAIVVLLWLLTQKEAIESGLETISVKLLREVYAKQLKPLHAALEAARQGDTSKYEDLLPLKDALKKIISQAAKTDLERAKAFLLAHRRGRKTSK